MTGSSQRVADFAFLEAVIASNKGEWDRGFRAVDRALEVAPEYLGVLSVAVSLCLEIDDLVRLRSFSRKVSSVLSADTPPPGLGICADWLGLAAWKTGKRDIAVLAIRAAERSRQSDGPPAFLTDVWCGRVWSALALDEASSIERAFAELDAYSATAGPPTTYGSASEGAFLAAVLEGRVGSIDRAVQRFDSSLQILRHAKYMPRLAWTLAEYADVVNKRGGEGDAHQAMAMEIEALAIAKQLGMKALSERILRRADVPDA